VNATSDPNAAASRRLLVVIVNYKSALLTVDCLRSLEPEIAGLPGAHVVVVENGSGDGETLAAAIRENGWEGWVTLEVSEKNGGFAYGNNAAIRPALTSSAPPDYIWLLNPDTLVRPGVLAALVGFLESHPDVGIAASRLEDREGTPEGSAFRFPSVLGELENGVRLSVVSKLLARWIVSPPAPTEPSQCDWASGASLLVRRAVFDAVGLLDENYFMYFEEVDFCRRARLAGWTCWYLPQAHVVHLAGQSSGVTGKQTARKRRPVYWFQARRRYFLTHLGPVRTLLANLVWSLGFLSYRLRQRLQRKADVDPEHLLRDFIYYNFLSTGR
jgi:GT2 family glycosyltransferase